MSKNIFEELQEKKSKLILLANKAKDFGWIDSAREKEIIDKLNKDTLTIGVIGQMKCGKSTFLNSFVFEDDILPAATTPMTAALSVITYGEQKKIVAEFYTEDEWEEQKIQASRSLQEVEGNTLEESKIKAAKELVEQSDKLGANLPSYLGKTQSDTFDNLIEYVGAEGKYISITKSVTIYYPKEYLKGVEIVDTPGFNDPIVSREERTKAFLKKADVVLLMLYAGRPFDSTDRDILFKNVGQCGTGKVLIGINKYDIPYQNGETEDEIKEYVREQLRNACRECDDNLLVDILKSTEPIPLSAQMALLSQLPMSKIGSSDAYQHAWGRICNNFEISNQKQMREKSHIDDLISAIKKIIETEKEDILFRKPINSIIIVGKDNKSKIEKDIQRFRFSLNALNQPDDELEEKQSNLNKVEKRLSKKINYLSDSIDNEFNEIVRHGRCKLEDSVESSCKRMDSIIEGLGRFSSPNSIIPKLEREKQNLMTKILRRDVENICATSKSKIKNIITDFLDEVEEILMKYIPDLNIRDLIQDIENRLNISIEDDNIFKYSNDNNKGEMSNLEFIFDVLNFVNFGMYNKIGDIIDYNENKREMQEKVNKIRYKDVSEFLNSIYNRKSEIISDVEIFFFEEFIEPLQEDINQIINDVQGREQKLKEETEKLNQLEADLQKVESQIEEIQSLVQQ